MKKTLVETKNTIEKIKSEILRLSLLINSDPSNITEKDKENIALLKIYEDKLKEIIIDGKKIKENISSTDKIIKEGLKNMKKLTDMRFKN